MEVTPAVLPIRVSVLCVTRNQDENLRRCLSALSLSTLAKEIEIVVVDLASTDQTSLVVEGNLNLSYLRLPKNFGWTKAANIGLRSTQGESILFLDPRVELAPGAVEILANAVEENGVVAAAIPTLTDVDGRPSSYLRQLPSPQNLRPDPQSPADPTSAESVEYPGCFALLIRKSFLKGMNFLDQRYGELWADAEIAAQVKSAGRRILRSPDAVGILHPEQPKRLDAGLLESDWHAGAAVYLKKHHGSGFGHSVGATFSSLFSGRLGLTRRIVSGDKFDGTQE